MSSKSHRARRRSLTSCTLEQPVHNFLTMYGPVIQGKLVRLRPPKPDDAAVMITWFEDLEVTRFILLRFPPSLNTENEWLDRMAKSQDDIFWVIEHDSRPVGATAIHLIDWKN